MVDLSLAEARLEFHELVEGNIGSPEFLAYVRQHRIRLSEIAGFVGAYGVVRVKDCHQGRFDFAPDGWEEDGFTAFVVEAFGPDGETVVDIVAWPLDRPEHVMTIFGKCGLLGLWEAMGAATYLMGRALVMHKTPLDWLKAGCQGAAVVTPHVAARQLLDLPGRVAARDHEHGLHLQALIRSVVDADRIVVPVQPRSAA